MNQEIKKKWVKALRSGEYKQGTSLLYNSANETYCCLGVLCDLYTKETKIEYRKDGEIKEILPNEVIKWAGLEDNDPMINMGGIDKNYFLQKAYLTYIDR